MFCPFCRSSFDAPEDGGKCPNCGAKYSSMGQWTKGPFPSNSGNGHHETGSDAGEDDILLNELDGN
jgi:hypothetical protein